MIEIINGRIFIDGKESVDPVQIGYALLEFVQTIEDDGLSITLKNADVFVENIDKTSH
ncbi:MAG: hypothetical protein K2P85_04970 [Flavobacteriaceae bacterium]|nr:hypothetical protein [Flavobacteriaceae bacterium]